MTNGMFPFSSIGLCSFVSYVCCLDLRMVLLQPLASVNAASLWCCLDLWLVVLCTIYGLGDFSAYGVVFVPLARTGTSCTSDCNCLSGSLSWTVLWGGSRATHRDWVIAHSGMVSPMGW